MFKKILYFWIIITVIISFVMSFEINQLKDYSLGNFTKELMKVDTLLFFSDDRSNLIIIRGNIMGEKVALSEQKKKHKYIFDYIHLNENEKIENIGQKNIIVPVVKFKNSSNVILIPKNHKCKDIARDWALTNYVILAIAYIPLIIFYVLHKYTNVNS